MKPDRSNYESWLIDWLGGTLDEIRSEQFIAFLNENPDIKAEADLLSSARLSPEKNNYTGKSALKKRADELIPSQVEYLSVAYLENDLSEDQLADLELSLENNSENRTIFDSVQKIKLVPPPDVYLHKGSLKKLTAGQRAFRISVASLSAAATIAILILSYIMAPDFLPGTETTIAEEVIDTTPAELFILRSSPIIARAETMVSVNQKAVTIDKSNFSPEETGLNNQSLAETVSEPASIRVTNEYQSISRINFPVSSGINTGIPAYSLIASNVTYRETSSDDERGRIRKFIAHAFRERFLKDEPDTDDPLKPYEIARAGVDGLNKLLDWNMELAENLDEKGEVKSVYFSSGLLTFNSPVKKTDQEQ